MQETRQNNQAPAKPIELLGPNEQPINLASFNLGTGKKKPFDDSLFDGISSWLAKHGPALAKLLLIIGSGAGTIYNGIKAGNMEGVEIGWLVTLILSVAGLIVECGFAYGWSRRGSYDLAGRQRSTVDLIFNRSSYVMVGDLSLSVAEIAFGVGGIATYWIGIVQPIMAVHVVRLFYRLKGEHPEYIAEMEIVDLKANMKASLVRDAIQSQKLELAEKAHERNLEWAALRKRHEHGVKLVNGRWYDRQIKQATKDAVGQKLSGVRLKLGKLPKLLKIGKSRKN